MRRCVVCLLMAMLMLLLTACGDKGPTAPEVYTVGKNSVPSLDTIMEEGEGVFASDDGPIPDYPEDHLYYYRYITAPMDLALRYKDTLQSSGFTLINELNEEIEELYDARESSGTIIMGKRAAEGDGIFRIVMGWSHASCSVQAAVVEGSIAFIPKEPDPVESSASATTITEQVDYLKSMSPAELGLSGASMDAYRVFPSEGIVKVDNISCRQLSVYATEDGDASNNIVGTYLLSLDQQHLYRINLQTHAVEVIK